MYRPIAAEIQTIGRNLIQKLQVLTNGTIKEEIILGIVFIK